MNMFMNLQIHVVWRISYRIRRWSFPKVWALFLGTEIVMGLEWNLNRAARRCNNENRRDLRNLGNNCPVEQIFHGFLQFYVVIRVYLTFLVAQNTETKFRETSKAWLYVLLTVHFSNIWFLVSNLTHFFIISFHIPLHVSSHIVLIIRRIYCIYTAYGSLCVTPDHKDNKTTCSWRVVSSIKVQKSFLNFCRRNNTSAARSLVIFVIRSDT